MKKRETNLTRDMLHMVAVNFISKFQLTRFLVWDRQCLYKKRKKKKNQKKTKNLEYVQKVKKYLWSNYKVPPTKESVSS